MLRSHKPKVVRTYREWSAESMSAAIGEVRSGLSVRKAAAKYSVPKSSLNDRISGKVGEGSIWGSKPKLGQLDETLLIDTAKKRAEMGIGFSKHNFIRAAGELAKQRSVQFKSNRPSDMWWRGMKSRHDSFSLRTPEATASNRHSAMTKERLDSYFYALGNVLSEHKLEAKHVWNMDETGFTLSHKPGRVVAEKGARTVHAKCSTSRELITVIACANAHGETIPPHFIVPGKTTRCLQSFDTESLKGTAIKNANISISDSGWTKDGIGKLWFTSTFLPSIGLDRPQLLICDGHGSHNNVEFVELARDENIILVELPSHTSNWTQPLDRSVFKPMKNKWNTELDNFVQLTGIPVGRAQFFRIFNQAWQAATIPATIINGFKATGIFPFNPAAIPEEAYAPSTIYRAESESQSVHVETRSEVTTDVTTHLSTVSAPVSNVSLRVPDASGDFTSNIPNGVPNDSVRVSGASNMLQITAEPNSNNVNDVFVTVPLHDPNETTVTDLPLYLDGNGDIHIDTSDPDTGTVSDRKAIEVVESTIDTEKLLRFTAAYLSNRTIEGSLFATWTHYKDRTMIRTTPIAPLKTVSCNIFDIPKPALKSQKRSSLNKPETQYFVLTADEAYAHKKRAQTKKVNDLLEKEKKRTERELKRKLKLELQQQKQKQKQTKTKKQC